MLNVRERMPAVRLAATDWVASMVAAEGKGPDLPAPGAAAAAGGDS